MEELEKCHLRDVFISLVSLSHAKSHYTHLFSVLSSRNELFTVDLGKDATRTYTSELNLLHHSVNHSCAVQWLSEIHSEA